METLSIQSKTPFSLDRIKSILSQSWHVEGPTVDTLTVFGTNGLVYLHLGATMKDANTYRLLLDYSNVDLAKSVIEKVADSASLTVDNDFGTILPGNQFVERIKKESDWDWRC